VAGLIFYFRREEGKPYRLLGWAAVVTFMFLYAARGRGYYVMPVYPMLLAAGAVVEERRLASLKPSSALALRVATFVLLVAGFATAAAVALPLAPMRSNWWAFASRINRNYREEIGWDDLVAEVAQVRDSLPAEDQHRFAILTTTYGEAGAVDFYGPAYGLPQAISGVNNYWERGYGDPPPQVVIVLGMTARDANSVFSSCTVGARTSNRWRVINDETRYYPYIFVCRNLRRPWPQFWDGFRLYG
jgi:hypothetical protein